MGDVKSSVDGAGRAAILVSNWWRTGLRDGFTVLFGIVLLLRSAARSCQP